MFDLTDVTFVKRITVGSRDPESMRSDVELDAATALLNRCLHEVPRGRIFGTEKHFSILNVGEHQVVLQALVYHIAFTRKPHWLEG